MKEIKQRYIDWRNGVLLKVARAIVPLLIKLSANQADRAKITYAEADEIATAGNNFLADPSDQNADDFSKAINK